ncbi:MAG: hypothetical protein V4578_08840 [Pseudomonadota bacterium]
MTRPSLHRRRPRAYASLRRGACLAFAWAIFGVSVLPATLALAPAVPDQSGLGAWLQPVQGWYRRYVPAVEELRPLAPAPLPWQGAWYDVDRNYGRFERWFADHLGLRDLMIRGKNELDYRLFRSSSRVYYGRDRELYGRNLSDNELPATEALLATPAGQQAVALGVRRFAQRLRQQGITMVLIPPMEKQYFTRERLPFFAPRLPADSHFMALYRRLQADPQLHMIDVWGLLQARQGQFPIFYHQDFHWTDLMAHTVAAETTNLIARLEGMPLRWRHPLHYRYQPFDGVEARFSARLNAGELVSEPVLTPDWPTRHHQTSYDAAATGLEFETDTLDDPALLPATCMYGNSFSDGMLRAGLTEHYRKFVKLDRKMALPPVPALVAGRCRYLIVQILDIQADRWQSLTH